jgi:hypothetical protein
MINMIKADRVKRPEHYTKGIETWDYIISKDMSFVEGNIVKYVSRWKQKNGIEDLKKAKQYLDKLIDIEEKKIYKIV